MGEKQTKQAPIKIACRHSISLSDTLFDSSNPDHLVEYIRAKRHLPERPKELFSNSDKPRKSFKLELETYENHNNRPSDIQDCQREIIDILPEEGKLSRTNINENVIMSPLANNSPKKLLLPRVLIQNDSQKFENHPHARKVLLNEFEMTIKRDDFQPPVCSTPLTCDEEESSKNSKINKQSRKKSLILKAIKPLTPSELEAAKLIERLENKQITNNNQSNNQTENLTLTNNTENNEKSLGVIELLSNSQDFNTNNTQIIAQDNDGNRSLAQANVENPIVDVPISETENSSNKNHLKTLGTIENQENYVFLANHGSPLSKEIENSNKDEQFLPAKSPNRLTFVVQKLNNTITPPRVHSINMSPKSTLRSPSQMSPLARHSLSSLIIDKKSENLNRVKSASKIPKLIQTTKVSSNQKSIPNSPIQNIQQLAQNINEDVISLIEQPSNNNTLPIIVIPIYQTVNSIPNDQSSSQPKSLLSSQLLLPPDEFCDKTQKIEPTSSKALNSTTANLKIPKNNRNLILTSDEESISPNRTRPSDSKLLTDDEDISGSIRRSNGFENISNNIDKKKSKQKFSMTLRNNKTILPNKSIINETMQPIDLCTNRQLRKRKSSVIANNLINCHYGVLNASKNKNMTISDRKMKNIDKKSKEISKNIIENDVLTEILTPRYTPPPPIQFNEDDGDYVDFQYADGITDNQQQVNLEKDIFEEEPTLNNSIRRNGMISNHMKKQISLDQNFTIKSPRKQESCKNVEDIIEMGEQFDEITNRQEESCSSFCKNVLKRSNISNKSRKNKLSLSKTAQKQNENRLQLQDNPNDDVEVEIEKSSQENVSVNPNLSRPKILSNIQIVPCCSGRHKPNERKSPILSRCTSLSIFKLNNFNRNNQFHESEIEEIESVVDEEEKSTLINIEDNTIDPNVDNELIIDDPKAMEKFWRNSIANKPRTSDKRIDENDSLKKFYLNINETISNRSSSTRTGRRKLYSDNHTTIFDDDKKTSNNKNNVNSNLHQLQENNCNKSSKSSIKLHASKRNHKNKSNKKNEIIENIQADWDNIDEFNDDDDENLNFTTESNSIPNKSNTKVISKIADKATNDDDFKFKIPVPTKNFSQINNKSKNNSSKHSKVTLESENENNGNVKKKSKKESVEPKPEQQKQKNNYLNGKQNREVKRLLNNRNDIVNNNGEISADTTDTVRRSNRKRCPRIQYWTNNRTELPPDIFKLPRDREIKKRKKTKSNNNNNKDKKLQLNEAENNKSATLIQEHIENIPEPPDNFENQLSQLVDLLTVNLTENKNTSKTKPSSAKEATNVTNKQNKTKQNRKKSKKNRNAEAIEIKQDQMTIPETMPSTSNAILPTNEPSCSTKVTNNSDSGNGTDITDLTKEVDGFSWLKNLIHTNTDNGRQLLIERFSMNYQLELASFNDFSSEQKDGVEYYFCKSVERNYGFIKLKGNLIKRPSKLKEFDINFILFCGQLKFTVGESAVHNIKAGEVVIVKKNVKYSISNTTDSSALLLFIKLK